MNTVLRLQVFTASISLALIAGILSLPAFTADALTNARDYEPLFDQDTLLEPEMAIETEDALITRFGDRVRDRHAREPGAYDYYLAWYWEERTVGLEFVDRVAKGGKEIVINITSDSPLNKPNFRCFFRGINTVAEYHHNTVANEVAPNRYTTTIKHNSSERRELRIGDCMEFEFSPFLVSPQHGRKNYYGTTFLYVVGKGIVPWHGVGEKLDAQPLPESAWLGGGTTLPYQYSQEPLARFKQLASNIAPENAAKFMLGRRLHHTDFATGNHSEKGNPIYEEHIGKTGPQFIASSCVACHANNGRALPPEIGKPMLQSVIKVGSDKAGTPHALLGTAIQPQSVTGQPETSAYISNFEFTKGAYADGTSYELVKPLYQFDVAADFFSVRLTPQLVGLGLLEAIDEDTIAALADPDDADQDGISGRLRLVCDPQTGQVRVGRFGYKASQPRLSHQIAGALNSDMGVLTNVFPKPDGSVDNGDSELSDSDLDNLYRYVATLGVPARRDLTDETALRGEALFHSAHCAKCHVPSMTTSRYHPLAELRRQKIQPYTDMLLHDMGPELADSLGEPGATGAEWRTPPLWGIGLTAAVSQGEAYLHDGRARTLAEAILWHGGEATAAREAFVAMPAADRDALIRFLKSL